MFTPLIYGVIVVFINVQRQYINICTEQQLCDGFVWRSVTKEFAVMHYGNIKYSHRNLAANIIYYAVKI